MGPCGSQVQSWCPDPGSPVIAPPVPPCQSSLRIWIEGLNSFYTEHSLDNLLFPPLLSPGASCTLCILAGGMNLSTPWWGYVAMESPCGRGGEGFLWGEHVEISDSWGRLTGGLWDVLWFGEPAVQSDLCAYRAGRFPRESHLSSITVLT